MTQQTHSLRHLASIKLHQIDEIGTRSNTLRYECLYSRVYQLIPVPRFELTALLQRLITTTNQLEHMKRLRQRRSSSDPPREDKAVIQAQKKVELAQEQLESTMEELEQCSHVASQIQAQVSADIGNVRANPELELYSRHVDATTFNYEYKEYQKAAEIIAHSAGLLRNEVQVKRLQYSNCNFSDYDRLLTTWKATSAKDESMDDLADLMLS